MRDGVATVEPEILELDVDTSVVCPPCIFLQYTLVAAGFAVTVQTNVTVCPMLPEY